MRVRLFGIVRDIVEEEEIEMRVDTVGELIEGLRKLYPALRSTPLLVAVNREMVQKLDHPLRDTDEVAVFPPVGGG